MRLNLLPVVLAGIGLALFEQAAASPIRVVVVTSHQELTSDVHVGRPTGGDASLPAVAHFLPPPSWVAATTEIKPVENKGAGRHRLCGKMKEMKAKATDFSNEIRKMLGFPVIEDPEFYSVHPIAHTSQDRPRIMHPPIGPWSPPIVDPEFNLETVDDAHLKPAGHHDEHPHPHHHPHPHPHHHRHGKFIHRLHHAINSLGIWEGRAVAFVLGCGIGVLIRMFWVMTVLLIRFARGKHSSTPAEEDYYYSGFPQEETVIIFDGSAENLVLPPPEYTDEKVAMVEVEEDKN